MEEERFKGLLRSIDEMKAHLRGEDVPVRISFIGEPDPREVRERMALSQEDFAHVLGVEPETVQAWEQGRRDPSGPAAKLLQVAARYPEILLAMA